MNHKIPDFLFKYNRGAIAPVPAADGEVTVEERYVYSANLKLSQDGFTMSRELIDACLKASYNSFMLFWQELSAVTSKHRVLISRTKPIWPNFPADAMEASVVELYVANLLHFLTAGEWAPEFDPAKVAPGLLAPTKSLKIIPAADENSPAELIAEMYMRKAPLSAEEAEDVAAIMLIRPVAEKVREILQDKKPTCKESVILYVKDTMYLGETENDTIVDQISQARDVLRLASAMSGGDVSLAMPTRFKNFSRAERRFLMRLIEDTHFIAESMSKNREAWKRLGEKLHPGECRTKYPKAYEAFYLVRSNAYIETYEGKLQTLMKQPVDIAALCKHLAKRPGMYARYLDFVLRNCKDIFSAYAAVSCFENVAASVDTRVLMQLANHFRNRSIGVQLSTGKKPGVSTFVSEKEVREIPDYIIDAVEKSLVNIISAQIAGEGEKVYLDPELTKEQRIVFPVNARQMSSGDRVYAPGSSVNIPRDMDIIRAFLYWKGNDLGGRGYSDDIIDLDLSVMFLDKDFNAMNAVAYFSPKYDAVNGIHSGDRRYSGDDGAVEYVDFSLSKAEQNGVAYAMVTVNSFSGDMFSELDCVFCGWMSRDGETGGQFEPQTVQNRFDLTADSRQQASVLIDVLERKCYVVDMTIHDSISGGNVAQAANDIATIAKRIVCDNSMTLDEVLTVTGRVTCNAEEADVIITEGGDFSCVEHVHRIVLPGDTTALSRLVFPAE